MESRPPGEFPSRYVSWELWQAEHGRLRDHIEALTARLHSDIETVGRRVQNLEDAAATRAGRVWQVILGFLTGLVLPLLVLAVWSLLSVAGRH